MDRDRFIYHKQLNFPWLFKMAWRDSRKNRSRLLLFISSITLGIAALVATFSLGDNVEKDIDVQAKTLVGADLVIESNRPVSKKMRVLFDSLGRERSQERSFASMIYFTRTKGTRLVQVRALQGDFPYYGSLETTPAAAGIQFRNGRQAIVDKTLMMQYDAHVGDTIKVGDIDFVIAGILEKAPGRTGLSTTISPPVYIPLRYLEKSGLMQKGSRINYNYYFKYDDGTDIEAEIAKFKTKLDKEGLDYETVESRKNGTGRSFEDFNRFLTLISFVALLLGCIGVAGSVNIYMREKINSIAILRCLGANSTQAFLIYLFQVAGIGLLGSVIGAIFGTAIQQLLPSILKDFLPIELTSSISWAAVAQGVGLGLVISILFALLPLISIRSISPLNAIRLSVEKINLLRDPWKWMIYAGIILFIGGFTWWQIQSLKRAIVLTLSVVVAFLILAGIAWLLKWMVRKFFPVSWSYLWRQGLANLYRPNNQTAILISTIGLGAAFIGTLYFVHGILINQVALSGSGNQANMVLFDIQPSQKENIARLANNYKLPLIQQVPIVTMRIEEINGKTAAEIQKDTTSQIPRWAFENELRVTYRDTLINSEKLLGGTLGRGVKNRGDTVYISLEERYASNLHVKQGDRITFNVQGMLVHTVIGSTREVDWRRLQTNFRLVFPTGVLEKAPQFYVLVTRVPSNEVSASFQRAVVNTYPNVSIIDLGLILSVLDDVLDKIRFVIQFMAGFSIITGIIVLIASVLISKYQRMQETVLLRTLGASGKQILIITALEYFFLGALAAATGIVLSLAGSWALAKYSFEAKFTFNILPIVVLFILISLLTVFIGLLNSRDVMNKAPLEILRKEV